MTPGYEVRNNGDRWSAIRHDEHGETEFDFWDPGAVPDIDEPWGILNQMAHAIRPRWGRDPAWERTDTGWVAR